MATISCRCGEVCIQFPTKIPRATQECCCNDCHARLSYLTSLGGPAMPKEIQDRIKPTTFNYFVNRMNVLSGKDKIYFFLLRNVGDNHNMAASCCNTFLVGHSLQFSGNCVAVPVELQTLTNAEIQEPMLRWFPKDLSNGLPDHENEIPHAWLSNGKPEGTKEWEERFIAVCGAWGKPVSDVEDVGISYADLLTEYKQNGKEVQIIQKE